MTRAWSTMEFLEASVEKVWGLFLINEPDGSQREKNVNYHPHHFHADLKILSAQAGLSFRFVPKKSIMIMEFDLG